MISLIVLIVFLKQAKVFIIKEPTVIVTLDDANKTDYSVVFPYFKDLGIKATSFINAYRIDDENMLSTSDIMEMKEYGWDFQDHFYEHERLDQKDEEYINSGFNKTDEKFKELGLEQPKILAAPYASVNDKTLEIVLKQRDIVRLGYKENQSIYKEMTKEDSNILYAINIDVQDETIKRLDEIFELIEEAKVKKGLIIIYFHKVFEANPDKVYFAKKEYIEQIIEKLQIENFTFMTMKELHNKIFN